MSIDSKYKEFIEKNKEASCAPGCFVHHEKIIAQAEKLNNFSRPEQKVDFGSRLHNNLKIKTQYISPCFGDRN